MNTDVGDIDRFIERLPVGIIILNNTMQLVRYNDLALRLLQIDFEDCLSGDLFNSVDLPLLRDAVADIVECKSLQQSHVKFDIADRTVACTIKTTPVTDGSEIVLILEDISNLSNIEKMKQEFIGTFLHKIRNPLSTLKTSLELVTDKQLGLVSDSVKEILEMGFHEVNRIAVLLNDIRDLFLIETGLASKNLAIENIDVAAVIDGVKDEFQKLEPPMNEVDSRLSIMGATPVYVYADYEKTKKIIAIILKNALQYSDGKVELMYGVDEDRVTIQIRDHGAGIAEEVLPKIFTRYFREDTLLTRKNEGNGLGLFIAKSYAELMNGALFCESNVDAGTSFFITLPLGGAAKNG
ncbi:MAG: ATP-binding protein [Fibrobacterota bacterium]|nr:ATP-binding protein [Chitinispirillaceae bacterium]